jgi:hypothetical protein
MIDALRSEMGFPVDPMCRALGVSKSGYYVWKNRKSSARKLEEERIKVAIKTAHERGRGTYGPDKIQDELSEVEQKDVGINWIKRLRRQMKIRCKQIKKYKATTDSNHNLPVAPNLLIRILPSQDQTRRGWPISPIFLPVKAGFIWPGSRTSGTGRSSATP